MGIANALLAAMAQVAGQLRLRTWNLIIDPASWAVLNATPNPGTATRVFIASDGVQYALDSKGRYIWRSTDKGQNWTQTDFGSNVGTNDVYGRIVLKEGTETLLVVEDSTNGPANAAWYTLAAPPVRTVFTTVIRTARVGVAYDGEPLIAGDRGNPNGGGQYATVSRYVSGAWENVEIYHGYPNGAWAGSICKTSDGTYVAGFHEWYRQQIWVRRSVDFTTWGAEIDITTVGQPGNYYSLAPGPGGIVIGTIYGNSIAGNHVIHYSSDQGVTWGAVTPAGSGGFSVGTEYMSDLNLFIKTRGTLLLTTPTGAVWTAHDVQPSIPGEPAWKTTFRG